MSKDDEKKIKNQCLKAGRARAGASKKDASIFITDKQWEAIQSGAVSNSLLAQIINNADKDRVRDLATPRQSRSLSLTQMNLAKSMAAAGYTQADIADRLGVSATTVNKAINS